MIIDCGVLLGQTLEIGLMLAIHFACENRHKSDTIWATQPQCVSLATCLAN